MKKSLFTITSISVLMFSNAALADPQKCVKEIDKQATEAGETVDAKAVCDCIYDQAASNADVQAEIVNSEVSHLKKEWAVSSRRSSNNAKRTQLPNKGSPALQIPE